MKLKPHEVEWLDRAIAEDQKSQPSKDRGTGTGNIPPMPKPRSKK